jgi:replicative DNA helicase
MSNDRLPPYDDEAEKAVLGSLLIDGDAITKIITPLNVEDFFIQQNQSIYDACLSVHDRGDTINQITVAQELARAGKLEDIGGVSYLSQLIATVPTSLHIESYAQIVSRLSTMRKLISASDRIAAIGYDAEADVDDALGRAEDILFKIRTYERGDFVSLRNILSDYFQEEPVESTGEGIPYINTGFSVLDNIIMGLQRQALVVLGARTSIGKTSLALNIARNAAINQKACVALFSLEMSKQELAQRLLSNESEVSTKLIRSGEYKDSPDETKVMNASGVLAEAKLYIDDSAQIRVSEMKNKVFRLNSEHQVDLIIVDYLQLIKGESKTENRYQELSQITRSLKALARDLNVPVLALSQLRRPEHHGPPAKPRLSDLRDSGSIEQDADVVIFIHREEKQLDDVTLSSDGKEEDISRSIAIDIASKKNKELTDIIVAKNRNGPVGEDYLVFNTEYTKFTDYFRSSSQVYQTNF